MPLARSEVVFSKAADIPRDYVTNTVYHNIGEGIFDPSTGWQNHANEVRDVFSGTDTTNGSYGQMMAWNIDVKVYDMADALPRPEKAVSHYSGTGGAGPTGAGPPQLACCLSYYAGRNLKHLRGHLYCGPFDTTAVGNRRPPDSVLAELLVLGHNLFDVGGTNVTWRLYRPTTHDSVDITDIWVDDSWDIQRRRQLKATKRVTLHP